MGENKLETQRAWRRKNPEKIRAYKKAHYAKHREKIRASNKMWRTKNAAVLRKKALIYHWENRDKILAKQRARRAANPKKYQQWMKAHRDRKPNAWRVYATRTRAKAKGLPFDLDEQWFDERINSGVCELSGLPFDLSGKNSLGGRNPNRPSIDRKNPKGGYTKENCRLILWWLNRALIDLGEDYALCVFRGVFIKRGEILEYEDRQAA